MKADISKQDVFEIKRATYALKGFQDLLATKPASDLDYENLSFLIEAHIEKLLSIGCRLQEAIDKAEREGDEQW